MLVAARVSQKLKQICTYRTKGPLWHIKTKAKAELWLWEKGLQWGKIGGRVQINPKSCGKRQTTWRREKEETKSENREEIKAAEENKERDFRGRVQINPKSCGKRQTTWRREKKETKSQNREEIKAAEENKENKERDFNVNVSVMWVLKLELSHLMRKVSCPNFIGGAWSGAQLMRQKIWTPKWVSIFEIMFPIKSYPKLMLIIIKEQRGK